MKEMAVILFCISQKTLSNLVSLAKILAKMLTNQETERFSDKVLKRLFVLSYAPNGMWTYITSVYFMYHRDENDEIEEKCFFVVFFGLYNSFHMGVCYN